MCHGLPLSHPGPSLPCKLPLCSLPRGGRERKRNKKSPYQCLAHMLLCKPTAGTDAIGAERNRDGSSCLYTQVSSKPSRTCTVRATCSTSAADQYHIWKHEVPTAFVAPSLCPATPQSALHHSPHCASALPRPVQSCALLLGEAGSRECQRQPGTPLLLQLLTPPMTKQSRPLRLEPVKLQEKNEYEE